MAHQVQVNADGVTLPNGNTYDSGATVTLSDNEFSRIIPAAFAGDEPALTDLGAVAGTEGDLADLGDVTINSPQVGDLLKWTGSHWVNAQPASDIDVGGGGGSGGSLIGTTPFLSVACRGDVDAVTDAEFAIPTGVSLPLNALPEQWAVRTYNSQDESIIESHIGTDLAGSGTLAIGGYHVVYAPTGVQIYFEQPGLYALNVQADWQSSSLVGARGLEVWWNSALFDLHERFVNDHLSGSFDWSGGGSRMIVVHPSDVVGGTDTSVLYAYVFHTATGVTIPTTVIFGLEKVL